jgi:hypothetical protein
VPRIKAGGSFDDIAGTDAISKRLVQNTFDLAFLASDIIRDAPIG